MHQGISLRIRPKEERNEKFVASARRIIEPTLYNVVALGCGQGQGEVQETSLPVVVVGL